MDSEEIKQIKGFIANEFMNERMVSILSEDDEMDYDNLPNKLKGLLLSLLIKRSKLFLRPQA
tara:strand:- start:5893 stop:6078 length:186 start_codon:yes stop_codon:yes gene_type:complete